MGDDVWKERRGRELLSGVSQNCQAKGFLRQCGLLLERSVLHQLNLFGVGNGGDLVIVGGGSIIQHSAKTGHNVLEVRYESSGFRPL